MLGASFFRDHPWPLLPGRIMANVLGVSALEIGDPVELVVLVKSDDAARDAAWIAVHRCAREADGAFFAVTE